MSSPSPSTISSSLSPHSEPSSLLQSPSSTPTSLRQLLRQISIESRSPNGSIRSVEEKEKIQSIIKAAYQKQQQHYQHRATDTAVDQVADVNPADSDALPPTIPSHASMHISIDAPASSMASHHSTSSSTVHPLPAIFRQLSEAASQGVISRIVKDEVKSLLTLNLAQTSLTVPVRTPSYELVRTVSEKGEVEYEKKEIRLDQFDKEECKQRQEEEIEAIKAIFGEEACTVKIDDNSAPPPSSSSASSSSASPSPSSFTSSSRSTFLTVQVVPYPGHSEGDRGAVGCDITFELPPYYPHIRPLFHISKLHGKLVESDGMMVTTAVNEILNQHYSVEPLPLDECEVCLFPLIQAAQDFLVEYEDYLNDREYHARIAAKETEKKRQREAVMDHAKQVLASMAAKNPQVYRDYSKPSNPEEVARRREEYYKAVGGLEKWEEENENGDWTHGADDGSASANNSDLDEVRTAMGPVFLSPLQVYQQLRSHSSMQHCFKDLHVEAIYLQSIISPFLAYRFMKLREKYMTELGYRSGEPALAFHGTRREAVGSITTKGLVVRDNRGHTHTHAYTRAARLPTPKSSPHMNFIA